jgi:predicted DNA-binding transcriptional regulator YafY
MKRLPPNRRRPSVHITLGRAARLHRLIAILAQGPQRRDELLGTLQIGLRTFYRELELLKRCGIKIKLKHKNYELQSTAEEAEGRLPFPDPQLSFAEMAELARGTGPAAQRLSTMLEAVISQSTAPARAKRKRRSGRSRGQAGAG